VTSVWARAARWPTAVAAALIEMPFAKTVPGPPFPISVVTIRSAAIGQPSGAALIRRTERVVKSVRNKTPVGATATPRMEPNRARETGPSTCGHVVDATGGAGDECDGHCAEAQSAPVPQTRR
jgi:hypothetical protein